MRACLVFIQVGWKQNNPLDLLTLIKYNNFTSKVLCNGQYKKRMKQSRENAYCSTVKMVDPILQQIFGASLKRKLENPRGIQVRHIRRRRNQLKQVTIFNNEGPSMKKIDLLFSSRQQRIICYAYEYNKEYRHHKKSDVKDVRLKTFRLVFVQPIHYCITMFYISYPSYKSTCYKILKQLHIQIVKQYFDSRLGSDR